MRSALSPGAATSGPSADRDGKPVYRFEIRLQGDNETVFFDV